MNNTQEQIVGVRFQDAGKSYHFMADRELGLEPQEWAVVETVYGEQVGQITETNAQVPDGLARSKLRPVLRRASGLDMACYQLMQERAERVMEVTREEAKARNLDLKVVSAELTLDGNAAIVLCTGSVGRKTLSVLRRRVGQRLSCRVQMRTVGPRDHAKAVDGLGVCGEHRCCSRFLTEFQAISIRMAKDQAISMAPSDITGMCGRLRCCLAYEHEVYQEESKKLPRIKAHVRTEKGLGRVIDLDILKGDVIVEIPPTGPRRDRQRFRFSAEDVEVVPRK